MRRLPIVLPYTCLGRRRALSVQTRVYFDESDEPLETTTIPDTEFTLSRYADDRGSQWCLTTLQHPLFQSHPWKNSLLDMLFKPRKKEPRGPSGELEALYRQKLSQTAAEADELFKEAYLSKERLDSPEPRVPIREQRIENWGGVMEDTFWDGVENLYPEPRYGRSVPAIARDGGLEDGKRAAVFVSRAAPAQYFLGALQNAWPMHVQTVALMRNHAFNEDMDPALMADAFDESWGDLPDVPGAPIWCPETESWLPQKHPRPNIMRVDQTIDVLAAAVAAQPPADIGGFVVRLGLPGGVAFVPLVGLPENGRQYSWEGSECIHNVHRR